MRLCKDNILLSYYIIYNMDIENEKTYGESLSPDLADIMEGMDIYTPSAEMLPISPNDFVIYLLDIPWSDVFKLYLPMDLEERDKKIEENSQQMREGINDIFNKYVSETSRKRTAAAVSFYLQYCTKLKEYVKNYLAEHGITYPKAKEKRDNTFTILKDKLRKHIQSKKVEPLLYEMQIDESEELKIELKYTELGALIMWSAEIHHDLSKLLDPKILSLIDQQIKKYTTKLRNMYEVSNRPINYTENIASELCLDMLNYNVIPRCVQRHGKLELQFGLREVGHGLLPSVYNDSKVFLTSDANNTGNVEFSQVWRENLYNITNRVVPFLNIDGGAAPTQIGFQESMLEQEQLEKLKTDPALIHFIKPVDITIRSPTGIIMLHIKSNSDDLTKYNIEIFSDDGKEFHSIPTTVAQLTIQNVINIVNSVPPKFQFHAALLKSLGDLIPYQTVCLQAALVNNVQDVSVMGSLDYSMIFQLLGNVTYRKNGKDVTCELNQRRILTGVNMENANVYFPWSSTEKHVYQLLLYIYGYKIEGDYEIAAFKSAKEKVSKILYDYTHKHDLTSIELINFFMNRCIADLNECTQTIQYYPDSDNLIQNIEMSIQPLTNITNFKIEHITSYIQNKTKYNEILKDDEFSVNFDNLDYILAYIIARQSMLPTPTVFNLPNIQGKPTSSNDTHTRKRKRIGGKRKKTLRKK